MYEDLMISQSFSKEMKNKLRNLWKMVGNTPMIQVNYTYKGKPSRIFMKCEHFNLTGSIKDRMALYILSKAYEEGNIKEGDIIVETTSGNTGIALVAIGRALGHTSRIYMPNWLSKERIDIIKSLGAEIVLVSKEDGGFMGSIDMCNELAQNNKNVFLPRQFDNGYNVEAHEKTTGEEILAQLAKQGLKPDAFVAGVGTGGTVMGIGKALRKANPAVRIHPLEPAESPTLSKGHKVGSHRIQGISDEFIPSIVKLHELNEIVTVSDSDAIILAQKMARELGLAVGISSGANLAGVIKVKENLPDDAVVVSVMSDSNKKYLSTDLVKQEVAKEGNISQDVKFISFEPIAKLDSNEIPGLFLW